MTRQRTIRTALVCTPVVLALGLGACSTTRQEASGQFPEPNTIPVAGLPATSPTTSTTTPVTSTTAEPTTTTTEGPTTTALPTTTLPSNVEIVGAFAQPIQPVGTHNGPATQVMQVRLTQLGFWVGDADGKYGFATVQAVMAFQKYIGLPITGKTDATRAAYMTNFTEKAHGSADTGTLVEVDKKKQLLFIVQDGKTIWTFNTSTGSGIPYTATNKNDPTKIETGDAQTPEGLFRTTRERPDGWWDGDLGQIYRPKYFVGGIAIHGMTSVPGHPASHGCVRLSTMAMDFIWATNLIPLHTTVWVHS